MKNPSKLSKFVRFQYWHPSSYQILRIKQQTQKDLPRSLYVSYLASSFLPIFTKNQ